MKKRYKNRDDFNRDADRYEDEQEMLEEEDYPWDEADETERRVRRYEAAMAEDD